MVLVHAHVAVALTGAALKVARDLLVTVGVLPRFEFCSPSHLLKMMYSLVLATGRSTATPTSPFCCC